MKKYKLLILFFVTIIVVMLAAFTMHITMLESMSLPQFNNKIILSYVLNFLLATIVFSAVYIMQNKYKDQLGFFFIAGSFVKFLFFFIFFYPAFKADGSINIREFSSFFIPYAICLTTETFFMAKVLKKLD